MTGLRSMSFCDAVIASGFSLLPAYESLWDGNHENSSEAIFELDCTNWNTGIMGVIDVCRDGLKKFNTPTHDLVDAFDAAGDVVRKKSSIRKFQKISSWTDAYWDINNFPFCNKMRNTTGSQNQIFIRLVDIYLLKAGSVDRIGAVGWHFGSTYYVNLVRSRVGFTCHNSSNYG